HYRNGEQATSDFVWSMVIGVAEKLKKNGIPGYLTMMAYRPFKVIPSQDIPDNVKVQLAITGPWDVKGFKSQIDLIKAWNNKMKGKVWLWNWVNKYATRNIPGIPSSTPKIIGEYYQTISPYIIGAYMQSNAEPSIRPELYIQSYLNYYVFSKVSWKNSTDVNALLKDHYHKMFGVAAPEMEKVFNTFEKKWMEILGDPIDTPLGTISRVLCNYEIWEKVYSDAEIEKLKLFFKNAENLVSDDADTLRRVRFIKERFLDPIIKEKVAYAKDQEAINDLRFWIREIPLDCKINIDGKIDEPAWKSAAKIFLCPYESEKSKKEIEIKTAVRALRDSKNIYFAFDCEEHEM
ncbi:MAG: DUF4838 domain-containing protein, partial [Candidatus Moranbacteria bacterium]|nr:DUF4838 domain-containing protein [Candidatus Moranbacteria bacterium]